MPKGPGAGIAAGLSKLALDVGAELAKDEDVRKMGRKVMEQLKGAQSGSSTPTTEKPGKKGAGTDKGGSGSGSSKSPRNKQASGPRRAVSTSRTYADPAASSTGSGRAPRRPGLPHRGSHDIPGSGRSSPSAGVGKVQRSSNRAASYSHHHSASSPYYLPGYSPQTHLIQPGVPAEYALLSDPAYIASASASASPLSSPRPAPAPIMPAAYTHRAVLDARALDAGYGSDGYASPRTRGPSGYYADIDPYAYNSHTGAAGAAGPRPRERANSVGDHRPTAPPQQQQRPHESGESYFAQNGRLPRTVVTATAPFSAQQATSNPGSGSGADSGLGPSAHRLPAPPGTPPSGNSGVGANNKHDAGKLSSKAEGKRAVSGSGGASPASGPAALSGSGGSPVVYHGHGTSIVIPPHGTTAAHALAGTLAASAPATPSGTRGDPPAGSTTSSKRDGKRPAASTASSFLGHSAPSGLAGTAAAGAAMMTPSQSYDALASSRKRIGAGVPMADVTFAARCANLIYSLFDLEDTRDYFDSGKNKSEHNPTLLDVVFSDPGKAIKNWALFKRKSDGALIISVRGTSRGPDYVDDMLCHLKEKDFELEKANTLRCRDGTTFYAHSSFLRYAVAMAPEVCTLLKRRLAKEAARSKASGGGGSGGSGSSGVASPAAGSLASAVGSPLGTPGAEVSGPGGRRRASGSGPISGLRPNKLIITGHSAGGAVASLLYLLLQHHYSHLLANFSHVFCITFGSAACVRRTLPLTSRPSDQVLAFILRGDPVPRLDMNYGLYLLDHYARLPSKRSGGAGSGGGGAGANGLGAESPGGPGAGAASSSALATASPSTSATAAAAAAPDALLHTGPGHATAKQTAARDLDGEAFLSRLTELYGSERESERRASADGTLEVPLQDLFPAGEMLMIDVGKEDVWEIDAEKLEATSPVDVERHEMKVYRQTLMAVQRAQPKLIID